MYLKICQTAIPRYARCAGSKVGRRLPRVTRRTSAQNISNRMPMGTKQQPKMCSDGLRDPSYVRRMVSDETGPREIERIVSVFDAKLVRLGNALA